MNAELSGLTAVLMLGGLVGFWWGVFRKRGQKARWVVPSLVALLASPYFSPAWQAELREEGRRAEAEAARAATPAPKPKPAPPEVSSAEVITACQRLIQDNLKAPRTAKFPGWTEYPKVWKYGTGYRVRSWVDSQNSFGAMVRTDYLCEYDLKTRVVTILEANTR
ncbi:MAG: hypothetical protein SFU83_23480 [Meiothermus sp.]|nr:hypothetical protein [Meiothermus sp.]